MFPASITASEAQRLRTALMVTAQIADQLRETQDSRLVADFRSRATKAIRQLQRLLDKFTPEPDDELD